MALELPVPSDGIQRENMSAKQQATIHAQLQDCTTEKRVGKVGQATRAQQREEPGRLCVDTPAVRDRRSSTGTRQSARFSLMRRVGQAGCTKRSVVRWAETLTNPPIAPTVSTEALWLGPLLVRRDALARWRSRSPHSKGYDALRCQDSNRLWCQYYNAGHSATWISIR